MGWKSVREHYGIEHIVKIVDAELHIGSAYVGDLLRVTPQGGVTRNRAFDKRGEIGRYQDEIEADPARFAALFAQDDAFGETVPVYTYDDTGIVEKRAEEIGWPNVTTDGDLQYENRHFADRADAIAAAFADARAWKTRAAEHVVEAELELAKRQERSARANEVLEALEREYPGR